MLKQAKMVLLLGNLRTLNVRKVRKWSVWCSPYDTPDSPASQQPLPTTIGESVGRRIGPGHSWIGTIPVHPRSARERVVHRAADGVSGPT